MPRGWCVALHAREPASAGSLLCERRYLQLYFSGLAFDTVGVRRLAEIVRSGPDSSAAKLYIGMSYAFLGFPDSAASYIASAYQGKSANEYNIWLAEMRYSPDLAETRKQPAFRPVLDSAIARSRR